MMLLLKGLCHGVRLKSVLLLVLLAGTLQPVLAQDKLEAIRLYNRAIDYYAKGNTAQALELFEKSTAADPAYGDAWYNMGSIYYQMKAYDNARRAFEKALALTPADSQAQYNLGLALEKLGRYGEAAEAFRRIPAGDRKHALAQQKLAELAPKGKGTSASGDGKPVEVYKNAGGSASPKLPPAHLDKARPEKLTVETHANGFFGPTGMAVGPGGELYVANYTKNAIYRVDRQGNKQVFTKGSGLNGPVGMAYNPRTRELYVANYLDNSIARVSPEGQVSVLASGLNKPYSLMLDTIANTLFVSEQETNTISRIDLGR